MTIAGILQLKYLSFFTLTMSIVCIVFLVSSTSVASKEKFFDVEKLTISDNPLINTGWQVYQVKCAVCHGPEGLGDGPMKDILIAKPPDLTQISKRYGGEFPFQVISEFIDGRNAPLSHGTREMPVWGKELAKEAAGMSPEDLISLRIKALLTYLESIQK